MARRVAAAVEGVLPERRGRVDMSALFDCARRPCYPTRMARAVTLWALHDLCGYTYGMIAAGTGVGLRAVMKNVAQVRRYGAVDAEYGAVVERLRDEG